jgi:hypothetical protein
MNTILFIPSDVEYNLAQKAIHEAGMVVTRHKGNLYSILKNRYDYTPDGKITEKTLNKHITNFYRKSLIPNA